MYLLDFFNPTVQQRKMLEKTFGSEENGYFHKFATCVLESMDVSYGGDQFSSFRDGSPTEINMSLTFRELEILTKKMIEEGY